MNKQNLINRIKYSSAWNDIPCPDWVYRLIEAAPDETVEFITEYIKKDGDLELNRVSKVLVRCKDCVHYKEGRCDKFLCGVWVHQDHFCSWGENK